jgi:hypothetical protein
LGLATAGAARRARAALLSTSLGGLLAFWARQGPVNRFINRFCNKGGCKSDRGRFCGARHAPRPQYLTHARACDTKVRALEEARGRRRACLDAIKDASRDGRSAEGLGCFASHLTHATTAKKTAADISAAPQHRRQQSRRASSRRRAQRARPRQSSAARTSRPISATPQAYARFGRRIPPSRRSLRLPQHRRQPSRRAPPRRRAG